MLHRHRTGIGNRLQGNPKRILKGLRLHVDFCQHPPTQGGISGWIGFADPDPRRFGGLVIQTSPQKAEHQGVVKAPARGSGLQARTNFFGDCNRDYGFVVAQGKTGVFDKQGQRRLRQQIKVKCLLLIKCAEQSQRIGNPGGVLHPPHQGFTVGFAGKPQPLDLPFIKG